MGRMSAWLCVFRPSVCAIRLAFQYVNTSGCARTRPPERRDALNRLFARFRFGTGMQDRPRVTRIRG
jgi:hypothetical protein